MNELKELLSKMSACELKAIKAFNELKIARFKDKMNIYKDKSNKSVVYSRYEDMYYDSLLDSCYVDAEYLEKIYKKI